MMPCLHLRSVFFSAFFCMLHVVSLKRNRTEDKKKSIDQRIKQATTTITKETK